MGTSGFGIAVLLLALTTAASAADQSVKRTPQLPPKLYDWSGFNVGFHTGYGGGTLGPGTNPLPLQGVFLPATVTGLIGGYQVGYLAQMASGVVFGLEADISFPSPLDQRAFSPAPFNTTMNYIATGRMRLGYAVSDAMLYGTAGFAWGQSELQLNSPEGELVGRRSSDHLGWAAGVGFEHALTGKWTARYEYNYVDLGRRSYGSVDAAPDLHVAPSIHLAKFGLSYHVWGASAPSWGVLKAPPKNAVTTDDGWSIHGQTTFLPQGYPSFHSPYEGPYSLPGKGQTRESWTSTAFIGRRLWDGGEAYFNPELDQGFGLNRTLGLAGFSNGEAQKGGTAFPRFRAQRYFFRQTFGLGGEEESVEDAPNQLPGKRDIDRVTLTVGRFAVSDMFDANTYAHDPRADFMNWAIWSAAAYDFPADLPGFTRGAVVELNRKAWALRVGVFQVPEHQNSDVLVFNTGGAVIEWEVRYSAFDQPGKLRLGLFANRGNMGNYREALAIADFNPTIDINDAIAETRRQRPKQGFYVNAEQALGKDVGLFARFSWNDGKNEILSFTDIDRSLSGGVSIMGASWGRPNDRIGVAGAVNGLSAPHRDFLAAGGLGLLIGDGMLNYAPEKIIEAFYACNVNKWSTVTFDYQFIADPAYNADRGPVSIFAARLHGEF
ncbi:MAG: carbohydrate porin [Xanthobacteraceae bacterium]